MILCEARERAAPVTDSLVGPAIELRAAAPRSPGRDATSSSAIERNRRAASARNASQRRWVSPSAPSRSTATAVLTGRRRRERATSRCPRRRYRSPSRPATRRGRRRTSGAPRRSRRRRSLRSCQRPRARRTEQECAEDGELRAVRQLAQDEVPGAEAGAEARDRREGEDHSGPDDDGRPQRDPGRGHGREQPTGVVALRPVQKGERQGKPVRFRHGPAAVRGVARRHDATGPAGKAAEEGAPSQKTFRAPASVPLAEGGIVRRLAFGSSSSLLRSQWPTPALAARRPRAGRRQDHHHLRCDAAAADSVHGITADRRLRSSCPSRPRSARSRRPARGVSSSTSCSVLVRALRQPDRSLPGGRYDRLGVQGQRRVAAGRRDGLRAQGGRRGPLVLRPVR